MATDEDLVSRFFTRADRHQARVVGDLPADWWSRPYEYPWAADLADPDGVVLDAGCGLGHPFKFLLADRCREVHACDIDPAITDGARVIAQVTSWFGTDVADAISSRYLARVHWRQASVTDLPYAADFFDRIFCLSVLEHLAHLDVAAALREFARSVRPTGLVVLTLDHPTLPPADLLGFVAAAGLAPAGPQHFDLPADAIHGYGLSCYRVVLKRAAVA